MADPRPDTPISIRDVAALIGVRPRTLKSRMLRRTRATGERLLFALVPGGKLYTTLDDCRRAFGDGFARAPTDEEWRESVERRLKATRDDLNALARGVRKIAKARKNLQEAAAHGKTARTDGADQNQKRHNRHHRDTGPPEDL